MKDWCDRRKIKLVIAILPDQFQVDPELRKAIFAKYKRIKEKNIDLTQPDNLIVNFCRAQNIHCLDLLGQFQEQGKTRQLYTLRDTHWNEAGNRLAADLIFEYLEKNQLIAPRAAAIESEADPAFGPGQASPGQGREAPGPPGKQVYPQGPTFSPGAGV